jgi:hypothetical protein
MIIFTLSFIYNISIKINHFIYNNIINLFSENKLKNESFIKTRFCLNKTESILINSFFKLIFSKPAEAMNFKQFQNTANKIVTMEQACARLQHSSPKLESLLQCHSSAKEYKPRIDFNTVLHNEGNSHQTICIKEGNIHFYSSLTQGPIDTSFLLRSNIIDSMFLTGNYFGLSRNGLRDQFVNPISVGRFKPNSQSYFRPENSDILYKAFSDNKLIISTRFLTAPYYLHSNLDYKSRLLDNLISLNPNSSITHIIEFDSILKDYHQGNLKLVKEELPFNSLEEQLYIANYITNQHVIKMMLFNIKHETENYRIDSYDLKNNYTRQKAGEK